MSVTVEKSQSAGGGYFDSCLGPWYRFGRRFEHAVEDGFESLGRSVGRHPRKYCLAVVVFVAICSIGFINFRQESDGDDLWVPSDTRAQDEKAYVDNVWGDGYRGGTALFEATDGNVLTMRHFEEVWKVQDIVVEKVKGDGVPWEEICGPRYGEDQCFINGPLQFFLNNRTFYDETVKCDQDLRVALSAEEFPDGTRVNRDLIFARYDTNDDDELTSAKGTAIYFQIDDSPLDRALDWEEDYLDRMENVDVDGKLNFFYIANRSLSDVFGASIQGDVVLTSITYILMIVITCIVFAKSCALSQMRIVLALSGIGIVIMSMLAGYGMCSGFSVPFVPLHQVLPFVVVGIGVDDMFIIVATFDAQDDKLPAEERLARALRRCGISITYTTLTDVMAFLLGATSTLPAIWAFCYYAAASVGFNFCFQITMFSALLTLDAKRMDNGYPDIIGCCFCTSLCVPRKIPSTDETALGMAEVTKGEEGSNEMPAEEISAVEEENDVVHHGQEDDIAAGESSGVIEIQHQRTDSENHCEMNGAAKIKNENDDVKSKITFLQRMFRDYYFPFIIRTEVRIIVVLGFLALFAVSIFGATQIQLGFDQTDFATDGSYVRQYFDAVDDLGLSPTDNNLPVDVYYKQIDYYKQSTQEEILRLQRKFLKGKFNTGPFTSWLEDFIDWVPTSDYADDLNSDGFLVDKVTFYQAVEDFTETDEFSRYAEDIIFTHTRKGDKDSLVIKASRTGAFHKNVDTVPNQLSAMSYAREVVDDSSINSPQPIAFSPVYINYETFVVIVQEFVFNMVYALVAVLFISTFILIRPSAVLLVGLLVAVIDVDLVGLMFFWDLEINSVTVVQLVMAVGLVVDYVSHIMHYYLQQDPDRSANDRLKDALVEIGPSVLMGCTTTFVGVLPLAFSATVIFRTFFKMFLLIITLGAGHGLVLLPAILPLIPFSDVRRHYEGMEFSAGGSGKGKLSDVSVMPEVDEGGLEMQTTNDAQRKVELDLNAAVDEEAKSHRGSSEEALTNYHLAEVEGESV